jgi:pimeloyl-ACP methyl ester carboxylesterase
MPAGLPIDEAKAKAVRIDAEIQNILLKLPRLFPGTRTDYHGFNRYDFDVDGTRAVVVTPHEVVPNSNLPWIWRAEFFDHRPELDLALLARGYHLVYIEVGNTFGAPSAMKHWDAFYRLLTTRYGLSRKPTLEGLSRGGLYIYNWAARHPNCVSVLYGDNPVCDFKSWPGGKGVGPGSPDDWKKLQQDYGFKSEAEALAYKLNPIDNLAPLAKAHVPIIHCAADADEAVPYEENTVILKKRYEALGGEIRVIVKHGFHHHPHGLDDPTPLVDFIFAHTNP